MVKSSVLFIGGSSKIYFEQIRGKISTCDMKEWRLGVRSLSRDGQGDEGQKG